MILKLVLCHTGAVTLELLTRRQLLPVGSRLADYESRVHSLALVDMAGVPFELEQTLRAVRWPGALGGGWGSRVCGGGAVSGGAAEQGGGRRWGRSLRLCTVEWVRWGGVR